MQSKSEIQQLAESIHSERYMHSGDADPWLGTSRRVAKAVVGGLVPRDIEHAITEVIYKCEFMPGGRYLWGAGRNNVFSNCMVFGAPKETIDSIEGWGRDLRDLVIALKRGVGVGLNASDIRPEGSLIGNDQSEVAGGPMSYFTAMHQVAAVLRKQRRAALMFLLSIQHPDVLQFINAKALTDEEVEARKQDYNYETPFNRANFSVVVEQDFFQTPLEPGTWQHKVWDTLMYNAVKFGEPGIVIPRHPKDTLTNVCGEYRAGKDRSACNLGSVNLSAMRTMNQIRETARLGAIFLMCGIIRSRMPIDDALIEDIGLGIMGIHSFLIKRGLPYAAGQPALEEAMEYWSAGCAEGVNYAKNIVGFKPTHTKAIAPNGTIAYLTGMRGIDAYATPSAEPLFAARYIRRRYLSNGEVELTDVVDPVVKAIPASYRDVVQDAGSISVEDRLAMLAFLQPYLGTEDDPNRQGGISTTINLPAYESEDELREMVGNISKLTWHYGPSISGVTYYVEGSRGLSPLTRVPLTEDDLNYVENPSFEDIEETSSCRSGVCGT